MSIREDIFHLKSITVYNPYTSALRRETTGVHSALGNNCEQNSTKQFIEMANKYMKMFPTASVLSKYTSNYNEIPP